MLTRIRAQNIKITGQIQEIFRSTIDRSLKMMRLKDYEKARIVSSFCLTKLGGDYLYQLFPLNQPTFICHNTLALSPMFFIVSFTNYSLECPGRLATVFRL